MSDRDQLIRKLARIEMLLEEGGLLKQRSCTPQCPADDMEGHGPCRCGAAAHNRMVAKIKKEFE